MKRIFWITLGASAGVLIARQLRQSAQQLTPSTLVSGFTEQAKAFWADVRVEAAAREVELREDFGLDEAAGSAGPALPRLPARPSAAEATAPATPAQPNSPA